MFELAMASMGFMFFVTYGVLALIVFIAVATERNVFATCALVFGAGVMYICGDAPDTSWIQAHPFLTLGLALGYLVAGISWSFLKWYFFLKDRKVEFLEKKADHLKLHGSDSKYAAPKFVLPRARTFKGKIVSWMMYWPVSVLATCFFDFIHRFWSMIYNRISKAFEWVANKVYADMDENDLVK
jgi:hypothetical protein